LHEIVLLNKLLIRLRRIRGDRLFSFRKTCTAGQQHKQMLRTTQETFKRLAAHHRTLKMSIPVLHGSFSPDHNFYFPVTGQGYMESFENESRNLTGNYR